MKTENIKQVFGEYLETSNTNYAILISGAWGSGKTYLWKNELAKMAESKGFKPLYLSLNGIGKIENLEYQLFLKLIPYLGKAESRIAKSTTALLTNVLNGLSKTFMKVGLNEVLKDVRVDGFNFSKYVIAFDDLERCQIPIKEVLGFINNYVEHKSLKTIIMADELNMAAAIEKDQKGYDNIKEKVIGRILSYEPDLQTVLPTLVKKYESANPTYFRFLGAHSAFILDLLNEYKEQNLRVIAFYLDILERLEPFIKNTNQKYVKEVIISSLTICLEFKKGKIVTSDSKDFKKLDDLEKFIFSIRLNESLSAKSSKKEDKPPREITYAEKFYETYLNNHSKLFFFYPSIYAFILTGFLDKSRFEEELIGRVPVDLSDEEQSFRDLINVKFRHLSNETFSVLSNKVIEYARQGKYSIYDYPSIMSSYSFFQKNGLVGISATEIYAAVETGLKIAKESKETDYSTYENLMHFKHENEDVEKVKLLVKEAHIEVVSEVLRKDAMALINSLKGESELETLNVFEKYRMSDLLFPYIESNTLAEALIQAPNKQIDLFTTQMEKRYNAANIADFLNCDLECLNKAIGTLRDHVEKTTIAQLRKYLIEELICKIGEICSKLAKIGAAERAV